MKVVFNICNCVQQIIFLKKIALPILKARLLLKSQDIFPSAEEGIHSGISGGAKGEKGTQSWSQNQTYQTFLKYSKYKLIHRTTGLFIYSTAFRLLEEVAKLHIV